MNQRTVRQIICPILAAVIWGTAFAFQSMSTEHIGPFTFNVCRSVIATVTLLAAIFLFRAIGGKKKEAPQKTNWKQLLLGGFCCGLALTAAANLQQLGLVYSTAGKAAFITALYIVLVPLLGLFLRNPVTWSCLIGVLVAVAGLYFLCVAGDFRMNKGDFYLLICAFLFALHILSVDHFTNLVDGLQLSCCQFIVVTVLSGIGMLLVEEPVWSSIKQCIPALLYVGIFSSGVAYTLQIIAQKDANPTIVALLLSLESVFGTIAGAVILHEQMIPRELLGCGLMLTAIIMAQIPVGAKKKSAS